MKAFERVFIVIVVFGLSLAVLTGCENKSPTVIIEPTPTPPPTPTPQSVIQSQPVTLLDTTVALNANARCANGLDFCADYLTFVPTRMGKSITVRVTAPSNLDPDVSVFNSAGAYVAGGNSYNPGSEVVTFTPYQIDTFRVRVDDYQEVGGTVHVKVTQQ